MIRPLLICTLLSGSLTLMACKPNSDPSKDRPLNPPTTPSPDPASNPPASPSSGPASKISLPAQPSHQQALEHCEAFMGFEKNDCLDKVRRDFPKVVA